MILTKENISNININEIIDDKIRNGQFKDFLIVVPTNRKLRKLKKEIISIAKNKTATFLNIETLTTLSGKILGEEISIHPLSDEASAVFIEQSAKEVELLYFNNYEGNIPTGTLGRIKNVISKYKEEGITPEVLLMEAQNLEGAEKRKAIDIANIYKIYLNKCRNISAFELGDIYQELVELKHEFFEKHFSSLFDSVQLIVFQGFDKFTFLETKIIDKIAGLKGKTLYLIFDYNLYNSMVFSNLEETYSRLNKLGFKKIEEKEQVNPKIFIEEVKRKLFLNKNEEPNAAFQDKITKIVAGNRKEEVELIAKEIKNLLLLRKAKPNEISVTFNLIGNYSSIVRDTFTNFGIPFNLTDRLKLSSSLSVIAIIGFLEILDSDFYYKNILRVFSNSLLKNIDVDINAVLFSASKLKIIAGKNSWENGLKHAIIREESIGGLEKSKRREEHFRKTLKSIENIDDYLKPFTKPLKPLAFHSLLKELIHKLNIPNNILESNLSNKEMEIKALTTFIDSTHEIFNLIEKERDDIKEYPISFYLEKLSTLANNARFNIKERSNYGVLITNMNELRGLKFKYSFIGGLIDGDFPTKYRPEIFFSGKFSSKEREHLAEERFRFYQSLASWNKGLFLSLPSGEGDDVKAESTFLKDFEKAFKIQSKTIDDYKNFICSEEEAQKKIPIKAIPFIDESMRHEWLDAVAKEKLRVENPNEFSSYSGFVLDKGENLYKKFEADEPPYSISQLETFVSCPFKYFLERVLKIEITDEPDEEVEAVQIGSLLHNILYQFYSQLKEKKIVLSNCSDKVFSIASKILFDIAEKETEDLLRNSPLSFYEKEKIIGVNENREASILYQFLLTERESKSGRTPAHFETNFGVVDKEQDKSLSLPEPLILDDIKLRGKIDRIDIDNNSNEFEIIDYKSGSKRVTTSEIIDGLSLQLPVYVWAAKELLMSKTDENFNPVAMTIYSLKYSQNIFGKKEVSLSRKKNVNKTDLINEYVSIALEHVKESVKDIRAGAFPLTKFIDDRDKVCRFCSYKTICRVESVKI